MALRPRVARRGTAGPAFPCARRPALVQSAVLALALVLACQAPGAAAWMGHGDEIPGGPPNRVTKHLRQELTLFPYLGRGDGYHSFHHPFRPSMDTPIDGWMQLGSALIMSHEGRDIVRLTNAASGNQGILYAQHHTTTNDINGYFDIFIGSSTGSHEPADGMGFFFTERPPSVGSAMGMEHTFRGLGIIIDTFSNSRTRTVPYMYAYVSNGDKSWNPDTDGGDSELTKGCKLEMDVPIRVFMQLLDNNLHVAVSTNHNHDRWHTCFKYNNVPMPFSHGGHIAFAGETGHYFANHDVHAAAFAVGDVHNDPQERERLLADTQQHNLHDQQHAGSHHDPYQHHDSSVHQRSAASGTQDRHASQNAGAASATAQQGTSTDAHSVLAHNIDARVHQVYAEFGDLVRAHTGKGSNDELLRSSLEEISAMTSHLLTELDAHTTHIYDAARNMIAVKNTAADLRQMSSKFSGDVTKIHDLLDLLRQSHTALHADNADTHSAIIEHSTFIGNLAEQLGEALPRNFFSMFVFLMSQVVIALGFYVVYKLGGAPRKASRMV